MLFYPILLILMEKGNIEYFKTCCCFINIVLKPQGSETSLVYIQVQFQEVTLILDLIFFYPVLFSFSFPVTFYYA